MSRVQQRRRRQRWSLAPPGRTLLARLCQRQAEGSGSLGRCRPRAQAAHADDCRQQRSAFGSGAGSAAWPAPVRNGQGAAVRGVERTARPRLVLRPAASSSGGISPTAAVHHRTRGWPAGASRRLAARCTEGPGAGRARERPAWGWGKRQRSQARRQDGGRNAGEQGARAAGAGVRQPALGRLGQRKAGPSSQPIHEVGRVALMTGQGSSRARHSAAKAAQRAQADRRFV